MTIEQEDNELTYPIGLLDMERAAAISKAHDLLDALIDSNARRDLIDMQFAKLRGKVDSELEEVEALRRERDSLRAQLENACASQADTDASKVDRSNDEMQTLRSERDELASELAAAKESLKYAADLMSGLLKDDDSQAYVKRHAAEFTRRFKVGVK